MDFFKQLKIDFTSLKNNQKSKNLIFENFLKKKTNMKDNEFTKHKLESLKMSIFVGLFLWLVFGLFIHNILRSLAIATIFSVFIFIILIHLSTEIRTGKSFAKALEDSTKEKGFVTEEFKCVINDIKKGLTFEEALDKMNKKFDSLNVKRALSNLANIQRHGKKDVTSIKKLAQELLLKQRIESKEFSNKMVMYSLVFIAISAIVPAMFQSFILVGSYFMALSFTAEQVFLIIVVLFPLIDISILGMINSKTPEFLKQ